MKTGRMWLWAVVLAGALALTNNLAWAVSQSEIVRLKDKAARGELFSRGDRELAARALHENGSRISYPTHSERPRQPGGRLDEYQMIEIDYEWVDISGIGQPAGISFDDEMVGPFDLGFAVTFFDESYSSVYMCSNGWAGFLESFPEYWNEPIPNFFEPGAVMYAFWDDLYPPMGGQFYYYQDAANDRFIMSWIDIPHISDNTELYTFQIIINASGNIQFNYQSVATGIIGNTSCTSGIENATSDEALQVSHMGAGVPPVTQSSILIGQPDGVPNPVTNLQGSVAGHDVTLTWVDPTQDTNGNPITLTNVQVFMGPPNEGNLLATVAPGVQTALLTNVADGNRTFYVRAFATPYPGGSASVTLLVGSPSYVNDFELDDGLWVPDMGWQWGPISAANVPQPPIAPTVWGTGLDFGYPDFANYNLVLDLGLTIASADAYIEFYTYFDLENFWDGCNLKASLDGGETWEIVDPDGGYPCPALNQSQNVMTLERCWSGWSENWIHVVIPLGQYEGEAPILRLQMGSDEVVSGFAGIFIDDMIIWGLADPVTATVTGHVSLDGGTGLVQNVVVRANGLGIPVTNPLPDGSYTLNNVLVGNRLFRGTLAGYNPATVAATVPEGGATNVNITLVRSNPPAPTGLTGNVNSGTGLVTLNWTTSPDPLVDQYRIYRRLAEEPGFAQVGTSATNSFQETITVDGIYQYRVSAVDLNVSTPVESDPSLTATVLVGELPVDFLGTNGNFDDRIRLSWLVPGTLEGTELSYDDGSAEFYFFINFPSGPTDYFAVRMTPPDDAIYPLLIFSAAVFVQNQIALPWVGICPPLEDGSGPDVDNPLYTWTDLVADGAPGWVTAVTNGDLFLEEPGDFYVVMQIPSGYSEDQPAPGADDSAPDSRSYYSFQPPVWNQIFWTDGLFRAWVGGAPPQEPLASGTQDYYMLSNGGADGYAIERVPGIPVNQTRAEQPQISLDKLRKAGKRGPVRETVTQESALDRWFKPYVQAPELQLASRNPGHHLDDITNYRVYRDGTMIAQPTALNYEDLNRVENVEHDYHVTAMYDNGVESPPSPTRSERCNMRPNEPTNLDGAPLGNTQMHLTWTAPTNNHDGSQLVDLANYKIYRTGQLIATVPAGTTVYNDTPPQNDGYYVWTVTATDEVPNESDPAAPFLGSVVTPWEQIDYEWVDITGIGTLQQFEWFGAVVGPLDLGFQFPYFEQEYSQIWIAGLGWASVLEQFSGFFYNQDIPDNTDPHGAIYPFWDELYTDQSGGGGSVYTYHDAAEDRFIVSWINMPHLWDFNFVYSFQMILGEDGSIIFNYQSIPADGWPGNVDCTIGVEDQSSVAGVPINSFGVGDFQPVSQSSIALWAGPSGTITGIVREFGSNQLLPGAEVTVDQVPDLVSVTDAAGLYVLEVEPGTYTLRVHLQGYCDEFVTNVVVADDGTATRNFNLEQPNANFSVTSLNILTVTGQNAQAQFEISNPGATCALEYEITTNHAWLTVSNPTGTIAPNQSAFIDVTGATAGFTPGDYTAVISIDHNDHDSPREIDVNISVASDADDPGVVPTEFALRSNFPNPFNASTVLRFDVPTESRVELVVYDIQGRETARPVDQVMAAGRHSVNFSAAELPSGMYLVRMQAGSFSAIQKIVLLK